MKRPLPRLAAAAVLMVGATAVATGTSTSPAFAVTCSQYSCDGQDPHLTGCDVGAQTVTSAPITSGGTGYGTINLRWSPTCQTNWAQIVVAAGSGNPQHYWRGADVYRQNPYRFELFDWYDSGQFIYGNMVYAPGCAKAEGFIQFGAGSTIASGTAMQPGCNF